jgi:iron complex outermembrane recepter protein
MVALGTASWLAPGVLAQAAPDAPPSAAVPDAGAGDTPPPAPAPSAEPAPVAAPDAGTPSVAEPPVSAEPVAGPPSDAGVVPAEPPPVAPAEAAPLGGAEPVAEPAAEAAPAAPAPEEQSELGTIVVTAQRRADTVQKTPIAISAFDQNALKQQNISNFRDLAGRVPGLLAPQRSTAYTTQTYALRGIGEIDTYPEPAVAVYVDDVYLARSVGSMYDTPDLERVEVLRGPQGTLYGRNSSAGAIRFITRTPTAERTAHLNLRLGTYDDTDIRARVSGAILPNDKLNGSVSFNRRTRRGYTYAVPLDKWVNDINIWALRAKFKSQITERFSATLAGDTMRDRSTQSYYTPKNQPNGLVTGEKTDPNLTWSNTQPLNRTTVYGGSLTLQYDVDDHITLKSISAIRGMHGPIYYDNDGVTSIKGDSYAGFDQNYQTQEFLVNGEYDRVNFVGGIYLFREYFHNHRLSQSASGTTNNVGFVTHTNNFLHTNSVAGFAQANIKIVDGLTGTLGGRYTADFRRFNALGDQERRTLVYPLPNDFDEGSFDSLFSRSATVFNVRAPEKVFGKFTPKVGLQYDFTKDLLAYASFSQGFKSGGYDLRANTGEASTTPYKPQTTTTYELGFKSAWFRNRATLNLAGYYNDIKGFQVRASSVGALGTPVNRLLNAGKAHSYGAELEAAAEPTRGLRIGVAGAYLQTEVDTFTAQLPANVAGRTTLKGLKFPLSPKWQGNLNVSYRLPIPTPGTWRIGGDIPYESKRYVDVYNTQQTAVASQFFINATASYTSESEIWSVGVYGSNLANLQRPQAGGYAPTNAGTEPLYYGAYNPPRMVLAYLTIGKL